jgi:hypothetical protein
MLAPALERFGPIEARRQGRDVDKGRVSRLSYRFREDGGVHGRGAGKEGGAERKAAEHASTGGHGEVLSE